MFKQQTTTLIAITSSGYSSSCIVGRCLLRRGSQAETEKVGNGEGNRERERFEEKWLSKQKYVA